VLPVASMFVAPPSEIDLTRIFHRGWLCFLFGPFPSYDYGGSIKLVSVG
jgi:hypothetical protein